MKKKFAAAFTEWERRYRADPEGYLSEMDKAAQPLTDHGELCAEFFSKLLEEIDQ